MKTFQSNENDLSKDQKVIRRKSFLLDTRYVKKENIPLWEPKGTRDEEPPFLDVIDKEEFATAFKANHNDEIKKLIQDMMNSVGEYVINMYNEVKEDDIALQNEKSENEKKQKIEIIKA